ncbi:cystathionine gamma-synthase [Jannaschia sp. EhC01]|uniref:Aminotransferase class I/II-fold pyridoxal phosphate-dependent enzyme n=1 Tax=Gymnodinialimonas phycosphaerae TaxID=2841589 RepID=A0A975TXC1_9RHOB|nr:aminotransferase class I/II-fold pyridoxal phosphate-dependent enzyme [Gymnodinialimonas phycosphaerae]MBY4892165.1 aminotransferase class I/II-fold pyridoxal phosphate-dependent enzyme [Gymnodinialimonas phycosphaerae]OAN73950.1 cystathionine gamma-synthase [Jannaschia sp. EhC01]
MSDGRNEKPGTLVRRMPLREGVSRPVVTPIQPSVVYASPSIATLHSQYEGRAHGYTYAREGHPNADLLARKIDMLEEAEGGLILGSGMAAVSATILGLLGAGDHIVGGNQLYGRSLRLMHQDLARFGIATSVADPTDVDAMRAALRPETKMILVEVISNPTLRVADMAGIIALAQEAGVILAVDNTFTTPVAYKPLVEGADITIHSVTKLLAGHSDVTLGYVAARDPAQMKAIYDFAVTVGMTPAPNECWLAERGLYTFPLRFEKAQANAAGLADWLADHPKVARVLYPGRSDHPDHAMAASIVGQAFGNMVSFELKDATEAAADRMVQAAPDLPFAPTLGDVGTTLSHPASSSHRGLTAEGRAALGISDGFFRVSVGIEDLDLLIADFEGGLAAV